MAKNKSWMVNPVTFENYIKGQLLDFAVREGLRYGSPDCTFAVAQVIANRVGEGWHGGDWMKVIADAPNFRGTIHEEPFEIDYRSASFRQALTGIDEIYHRTADDSNVNVTDDRGAMTSLYYCDLSRLHTEWFREHVLKHLDDHPRIAKVGELTFFA